MNTTTVPDAQAQAAKDRAKFISGLHEFADYLAANPWLPIDRNDSGYIGPARIQVDLHGEREDATAETISRVCEIAAKLGVKVDDRSNDRTSADVKIGAVSYSLIAWHKNGRPGHPDERDAELERLRAEVAALRSGNGLAYFRADSEPDDPTPVSPARAPLHVGVVNDGGLVDVTEAERELEKAHVEALTEDNDRAKAAVLADMRFEDAGRIPNPNLARFLAEKEEKRRVARHFLGLEESAKHSPFVTRDCCGYGPAAEHNPACMGEARPIVSDETIAEVAAMEERDRLAGGPPWEVPSHPDNALPGGWHRGRIR